MVSYGVERLGWRRLVLGLRSAKMLEWSEDCGWERSSRLLSSLQWPAAVTASDDQVLMKDEMDHWVNLRERPSRRWMSERDEVVETSRLT